MLLSANALELGAQEAATRAAQLADTSRAVAARATGTRLDPRKTAGIDRWWAGSFVAAEYGASGEGFEKMPDDYTPGMKAGRALSGHRRTSRVKYEGAGVALRMPSATAIRRYSTEHNNHTFDVPVSAEVDGRTVTAWVRVTSHGPRLWSTKAVGFAPNDPRGLKVAEAVNAVLESRRPRTALAEARNLVARRRARAREVGVAMRPLSARNSFISHAGYDRGRGVLVLTMSGRAYGYKTDEQTAARLLESRSPGAVYNALVKGHVKRAAVEIDPVTGRAYDPKRIKRRFGVRTEDAKGVKASNVAAREAAVQPK